MMNKCRFQVLYHNYACDKDVIPSDHMPLYFKSLAAILLWKEKNGEKSVAHEILFEDRLEALYFFLAFFLRANKYGFAVYRKRNWKSGFWILCTCARIVIHIPRQSERYSYSVKCHKCFSGREIESETEYSNEEKKLIVLFFIALLTQKNNVNSHR